MVYVINDEQLTRRKLVTIDGSKVTTETAIPLGLNINLPGVKAAGADVRLAKLDGTPIAREIECKDVPNTDDIMIWYSWDTTSGQNDQFWVYWGNQNLTEPAVDSSYGSEAVWNSNYVGVWHMNNDPTGSAPQLKDSTSNNNDGTSSGSMTSEDLVDGNYGKGIDFDGSNDMFSVPDSSSLDINTHISIMMRIKPSTIANTYPKICVKPSGSGWASPYFYYSFGAGSTTLKAQFAVQTNANEIFDSAWTPGNMYNLIGTYDGTTERLYTNGVAGTTKAVSGAIPTSNEPLCIGMRSTTSAGERYVGIIEELRLSDTYRSANYITTTHNNLDNPTSIGTAPFYLPFGLEQHQRRVSQFIN